MNKKHEDFYIGNARYAKNMIAVSCTPDGSGFKTRAARLAESLARGRYTHRERAYLMSRRKSEQFKKLYAEGWDASTITYELIKPR